MPSRTAFTATEAIYLRRAVRDFTSDPIPEATLRDLIDAAVHAPSAMNLQPWAFVVVQDPEILRLVSRRTMELMRHRPLSEELTAMFADSDWSIFYNASTLVVICARPDGERPEWDCCFAAENFMLAARERGLGTCVIGFAWDALSEPDIKASLGIPANYRAVAPIIVGNVRDFPPTTSRKPPEILAWKRGSSV